jgi:hypothetical protein
VERCKLNIVFRPTQQRRRSPQGLDARHQLASAGRKRSLRVAIQRVDYIPAEVLRKWGTKRTCLGARDSSAHQARFSGAAMAANAMVYLWTIPELLSTGIYTNLTNQEARFAVGTDCSATKGNLFRNVRDAS